MREVVCPKGHRLQITEAHLGKQVRCPVCSETFNVPETMQVPPTAAGELAPPPAIPSAAPLPSPPGAPGAGWPSLRAGSLWVGRPLVFLGLLLVLGARGCDALGKRAVECAKAGASLAEKEFEDTWDDKRLKLEDRVKKLRDATPTDSAPQREESSRLESELSKLRDDQLKEKAALEKGQWRDLQIKARDAGAKNQMSAYWRECVFVLGTILLAFGLFAVSWIAQGAERWISLIMLAIITFSVYVIGAAWTGVPM